MPLPGLAAPFGGIFPTMLLFPPVAVAVQLTPQTYPSGQQPPPSELAQLDHPYAQVPVSTRLLLKTPVPVGATMVRLFVSTSVVLAVAGQEVE